MRKKSSQQNFPFVPVRRHSINKKNQNDGARKQRNHKKADQNQSQIKAEHLQKVVTKFLIRQSLPLQQISKDVCGLE